MIIDKKNVKYNDCLENLRSILNNKPILKFINNLIYTY